MNMNEYSPQLARIAEVAKTRRNFHDRYFSRRKIRYGRDFFIACRHWNSSTPIIPRQSFGLRSNARFLGSEVGGGYFLVLNGVGIVVDPGYNFMQVLYTNYGYSIRDVDYVFITHDHPDHWADLPTILNLSYLSEKHRPLNEPERAISYYLNRSTSELRDFLFSDGKNVCHTIGQGQVVPIVRSDDNMVVAEATGLCAFHCERLIPKSNSPDTIGLHFHAESLDEDIHGKRDIAIASDTQFPSIAKLKAGLPEFTEQDVERFTREYDSGEAGAPGACNRGARNIDVLALHIGSVEDNLNELKNIEADPSDYILDGKNQVFYEGYHLGFAGCLRLLNMVFRKDQSDKVAVLTEFGDELRGYRVDLASMLEGMTIANHRDSSGGHPNVRVIPADLGMALQLTWEPKSKDACVRLRCHKCAGIKEYESSIRSRADIQKDLGRNAEPDASNDDFDLMDSEFFHPISRVQAFEDMGTGLLQYCCHF